MKKLKYFILSVVLLIVALSAYGQEPTQIGPGGSWTTARGIINTNMTQVYDSLQSLRYSTNLNYSFIESHADSITAHTAKIALRLLKSDTASMLANYTRNGELAAAIVGKLNVSDTASMLAHYALTSELGDAGTSIGDVRDEIADSLNVLRPLYVAVADTATMLDPYALLTDLSEGGISLSAVQDEIADSLNVLRPLVVMLADTTGTSSGSYVSGYTFQTGMSNKLMVADSLTAYVTPSQLSDSLATVEGGGVTLETVRGEISDSLDARIGAGIELSDVAVMIVDSTGNAPGNYVTRKALNDSINANLGGAVGITLNSGTITLNGDGGTADDIIFYTNGGGSYNLPAGGGNLTIMAQVQGWIADSLDAIRSASIPGLAAADTADLVATHYYVSTHSGSSWDSAYVHYRIDSLITVVEAQATEIANLWNAIETLGDFDLTAPAFLSAELGSFADDTLVVLLDTTDVRQDSVPPLTSFTLWAGATEHGIASVDINYDTLFIALDSAGVYGTVYSLDYTRGTPALQDSTGNKTASWIGKSVTNSFEEPEAGVPTFLTSDGYTWSWLEAQAANLTLNGSQITAVNDKGSSNHDWTGNGTPGAQWDAVNEEIDFTYNSSGNLELATSPSSLPVTVYMVVRITDWSDGRALMYFTVPTARISQGGGTNQLLLYAGQFNLFAGYTNGEYAVITATLNGATSSIQWNDDTPVTGNAGTNGISGIYLGYDQDNANFSTKEVIVRNNAESAQNIADVKAYLYSKYSITP